MRSILEAAFVALLNEEHDKAEELFHQFIVGRARQIHESNRSGDDYVLDENWDDEITTESYFTEDDLAGLEDEHGAEGLEGGEEGEEHDHEGGEFDVDGEEGEDFDHVGGEEGQEGEDAFGEPEEASADERIEDLEDQIEKLTAEFEAMMDAISDEGSEAEDLGADAEEDLGDEGEEGAAVEDDMDGAEDEEPAMESDEGDEFDDITESIVAELEKVSVSLEDGHEIGAGGKIERKSVGAAIPQKNKDARQGGQPIKMKQDAHKGFERETAPKVDSMPVRRNNVKGNATTSLQKVSKEGDKSAELNKLSSENGNQKSPLGGK